MNYFSRIQLIALCNRITGLDHQRDLFKLTSLGFITKAKLETKQLHMDFQIHNPACICFSDKCIERFCFTLSIVLF